MVTRTNSSISCCAAPDATSSIGTMSGGSLTIRRSPSTTVVSFAKARMLSFDCALATLRLNSFRCLRLARGAQQRADLSTSIREYQSVEVRHPGEVPDRLAVRARHLPVDRPPLLGVETAIAAGHGEARDESLDVPFERARQGLVEVVDAEHEPPIRRGERAEVREMRVTAELHVEPGPGHVGEIGRHRVRRAAIERERRDQHPPIADRHQLGHAGRCLLLQQLDGIAPIGAGSHSPCADRGATSRAALPLAARSAAVRCGTRFGAGLRVRVRARGRLFGTVAMRSLPPRAGQGPSEPRPRHRGIIRTA